jgi:NitT/TauT family transport system ATP-binding protein
MSNKINLTRSLVVSPKAPFIEFVNVSKTFRTKTGDVDAIRDVSLSIRKNHFVAIVGPSGCGKSTLLKMLAGLLAPSSGRIMLHAKGEDLLANVGMVFQRPALLAWRSVLSNILLPTQIVGMNREAAVDRAKGLLQLVGLTEFSEKYPNELSGGMQMRVALCRALICEPSLLLMDEPFGALDAMTREDLSIELLGIWQRQPKTVLFVTHSISEAILLADQVVVIGSRPGRVVRTVEIDINRPRGMSDMQSLTFRDYAALIRSSIVADH